MGILDKFECRAIEAIQMDKKINADNYENVGQYKLILKIRKTIEMAFRKDSPRSNYSLESILKPGKLWDECPSNRFFAADNHLKHQKGETP
jgi:hypothetical protein